MIAACTALSYIPSIPITDGTKVTWGFLARALCGLVGGPINALVFGLAEDTISFLIHPSGPYFPGYALTTMIGTMIYTSQMAAEIKTLFIRNHIYLHTDSEHDVQVLRERFLEWKKRSSRELNKKY